MIAKRLAKEGTLGPEMRVTPKSYTPVPLSIEKRDLAQFARATFEPAQGLGLSEPPLYYAPRPQVSGVEEVIALRDKLHITKILGQVHNTFIIAETGEGMMIIDQHAAHERINFEAVLKNFEAAEPSRQGLLLEEVIEIAPKHHDSLTQSLPFLNKAGFEVEPFGDRSFRIRSVPGVLHQENPLLLITQFLEEKEEGNVKTGLENYQEEAAALIACKRKSVKAFDALTPEAMRDLIERLARCENPFSCPHGRPTFLKYSFLDLEKQFKRK
jgi:DNA mismatch repair protein MutL